MASINDTTGTGRHGKAKLTLEHLARSRRNQQRCRERKREYVADLENQIDELKRKMKECKQSAAGTPDVRDMTYEKLSKKNNARRALLLALGIADEVQERYLESAPGIHMTSSSNEPSIIPSNSLHLFANETDLLLDPVTAALENENSQSTHEIGDLTTVDTRTDPSGHQMSASSLLLDHQYTPNSVLESTPFLRPILSDDAIPFPLDRDCDFARACGDSTLNLSSMAASGCAAPEVDSSPWPVPTVTERRKMMTDCLMDTVVRSHMEWSATPCSKALSLIFRLNYKGLSLSTIQERLVPGITGPFKTTGECCSIDDRVLADILAELSIHKRP